MVQQDISFHPAILQFMNQTSCLDIVPQKIVWSHSSPETSKRDFSLPIYITADLSEVCISSEKNYGL